VFGNAVAQIVSVGQAEGLGSLADDFKHHAEMQRKAREMRLSYGGWRRSRGDGNCYYRALGFLLVERLLEEPLFEALGCGGGGRSQLTMGALLALLRRLQPAAAAGEALPCTFDEREHVQHGALIAALENLVAQSQAVAVEAVAGGQARAGTDAEASGQQRGRQHERERVRASLRALLQPAFDGGAVDLPLVRALRAVAAAYLTQHAAEASPSGMTWEAVVCMAYPSVQAFCERTVEAMGKEAEEVVLLALPLALGVLTRIVLVDPRDRDPAAPVQVYHEDFGVVVEEEAAAAAAGEGVGSGLGAGAHAADVAAAGGSVARARLHLLFKPGHYDMLYAHTSEAAAMAAAAEHEAHLAREVAEKEAEEDHSSDSSCPLGRLRTHPLFGELRHVLQTDPAAVPALIAQIGAQDAALLTAIHENQQAFSALMNEPSESEPQAAAEQARH
jgi:hypothetical protein